MRPIIKLLLFFVFLFGTHNVFATWQVLPNSWIPSFVSPCVVNGSGSYPTIQSAIDDLSCQKILVYPGVYQEKLTIARAVELQGFNKSNTIIDGTPFSTEGLSGPGISIDNEKGEVVVVRNFTVRNWNNGQATSNPDGGAFHITGFGPVFLQVLRIQNNAAAFGGGMHSGGPLSLKNIIFEENSAVMEGGALSVTTCTDFGVIIEDSIFQNNVANYSGGAINSTGQLSGDCHLKIHNSQFRNNQSQIASGGALASRDIFVTITETLFESNSAEFKGGAYHSDGDQSITIKESRFLRNRVNEHGGAIYMDPGAYMVNVGIGEAQVIQTNFIENRAGHNGGGVSGVSMQGHFESCTFEKNQAGGHGGGLDGGLLEITIFGEEGTQTIFAQATVLNSTFSGNSARQGGSAISTGRAALTIDFTTIAYNERPYTEGTFFLDTQQHLLSENPTGGLQVDRFSVTTISNSVIAHNFRDNCVVSPDGSLTSNGYNLSDDSSCFLTNTGDLPDTLPQLGPLRDNGGPTKTHLPKQSSPAVDHADTNTCPDNDQRGFSRPVGKACDIGSVERDFTIEKKP